MISLILLNNVIALDDKFKLYVFWQQVIFAS